MSDSSIDQPIRLGEVMEPKLFDELGQAYTRLYGVGIKVFDRSHAALSDVSRHSDVIDWLFQFANIRRGFTAFVSQLKQAEVDVGEFSVVEHAPTKMRYLILPVVYEFEILGKLIVGPYLGEHDEAFSPGDGWDASPMDIQEFASLRAVLPRWSDDALRSRIRLLLASIDAVCHAGYQRLLTSRLHLESITSAYNDLQTVNAELASKNTELVQTNHRLRELDELKSNFLATVSHELRTPLTSVIGYSEMLLEGLAGPINPEQRDYISTIMERGESLLALISGLLDISKMEKGGSRGHLDSIKPKDLVEDALDSVRPQARKARVRLETLVESGLDGLFLDRYKVHQVLVNLLGNAVKFTRSGGTVTVRVGRVQLDGEYKVRFEVADTGIGIPQDQQALIFEAFHQVDNSSTREYGGTGLGLSIVKSFVESLGGAVTVDSQLNQGSTFAFTIPLQMDPHP